MAYLLAVLEANTTLLAFFFGLCFVAALLVLAIWFPQPTAFQYTVFRITLALAAAGIAGIIPGMIRLTVKPGTFTHSCGWRTGSVCDGVSACACELATTCAAVSTTRKANNFIHYCAGKNSNWTIY